LFEQRVKLHPDAVAAVHGDRRWTYRELNARTNRLARALLARGLRREDVVAVVTERNLDWMAAVLAVFKAGGVYLPIEPHFPAERIATTLARAECALVLTDARIFESRHQMPLRRIERGHASGSSSCPVTVADATSNAVRGSGVRGQGPTAVTGALVRTLGQ
jgi:non-ribosomal peptide synthetase component F